MSERNQSDSPNVPDEVWQKIRKVIDDIVEQSADGDYIYRGESKLHPKVCSGLYRAYADLKLRDFDIPETEDSDASEATNSATLVDRSEKLITEGVKKYLPEMDKNEDFHILATLQHSGGKTNLIDFTKDFRVALFFACTGEDYMDGRIILLKRKNSSSDTSYEVKEPPRTIPRAEAQKSVLVRVPKGFLDTNQYKEILIDNSLKQTMLTYLENAHGISPKRIYSDIHGFIRSEDIYLPPYQAFANGKGYEKRGDQMEEELERLEKRQETPRPSEPLPTQKTIDSLKKQMQAAYAKALEHYAEALKRKADFWDAYISRGAVHEKKGEHDKAINVYTQAIERKPNDKKTLAAIYMDRGKVREGSGDLKGAIQDFTTAVDLTPEDPMAYHTRAGAYSEFSFPDNTEDRAIKDYNKAIDLDPGRFRFYFERALIRLRRQEWDEARADLETARNRGANLKAAGDQAPKLKHLFNQKIRDFEKQYDVVLPKDIAEMLTSEGTPEKD